MDREEAVERALLFTFQLSNKTYRKMQTAMSEVSFIRALEQDGYTIVPLDIECPCCKEWYTPCNDSNHTNEAKMCAFCATGQHDLGAPCTPD